MGTEKKRVLLKIYFLAVGLISASCKLSDPLSGVANAIQNIFENIARSITIRF